MITSFGKKSNTEVHVRVRTGIDLVHVICSVRLCRIILKEKISVFSCMLAFSLGNLQHYGEVTCPLWRDHLSSPMNNGKKYRNTESVEKE